MPHVKFGHDLYCIFHHRCNMYNDDVILDEQNDLQQDGQINPHIIASQIILVCTSNTDAQPGFGTRQVRLQYFFGEHNSS